MGRSHGTGPKKVTAPQATLTFLKLGDNSNGNQKPQIWKYRKIVGQTKITQIFINHAGGFVNCRKSQLLAMRGNA